LEQAQTSLQESQQITQLSKSNSIYGLGTVTPEAFAQGVKRIKQAFPKLKAPWYEILGEMLSENEFTDERFKDAVFNLINTCQYPEPTIANILSFDKMYFTYTQVVKLCQDGFNKWDDFIMNKEDCWRLK